MYLRLRAAIAALVFCLVLVIAGVQPHHAPAAPAPAAEVTVAAYQPQGLDRNVRLERGIAAGLAQRDADVAAWTAGVATAAAERAQAEQEAAAARARPAPAPIATDAPPPAGSGSATEAIAKYFGDIYNKAVAVARCESGLNPGAVSPGGGNWGLFQINAVHRSDFEAYTGQPWSAVLNADYNAMYARKLYDSSGWGPWTCGSAS